LTEPLDAVSFRCVLKRSSSDSRDALVLSEMLGEDACGVNPVVPSVPIRLPGFLNVKDRVWDPRMPSVALGLPASDGCGRVRWTPLSVFGENRNVLEENELERSELTLGEKLRGVGVLGVKLCEGAWRAGGLKEGRDGLAENDLVPLNGLERIVGAGRLWLNEELGRLEPIDGLDRLGLIDGLDRPELIDELRFAENELCILDMRLAAKPPPPARPALEERVVAPLAPPDLWRPRAEPPAIGEISTAVVTTTTAARVLIIFLIFISVLLRTPQAILCSRP